MSLKRDLENQIAGFDMIGAPSLMQRFVVRNARGEFPGSPYPFTPGTPKQCFTNATKLADGSGLTYCEGFVWRVGIPLAIHHAWCMDGDRVVDPTLRDVTEEDRFLGVEFDMQTVRREILRTGVYGLLDNGRGVNHAFIFARDPELRAIVEAIRPHSMFAL